MITHCIVTDSSTVLATGPDGSISITGPLEFDCHSVTVSGVTYTGNVLVSSSGAFRLTEYTPQIMNLYDPLLAFAFMLGLICARFRL